MRDIVPAARTVLLDGIADRDPVARDRLARDLASWRVEPVSRAGGDPVEIPVVYDGPDLDAVAALWGVGADEVGALHSRTAFRVAFCGFAPGFGYLAGLPERLHVPRRTTPRTRVPAGAVALAGPYTGVYPRPSPGGWQLIGRMPDPAALWDPERGKRRCSARGRRCGSCRWGEGGGPHAGGGARAPWTYGTGTSRRADVPDRDDALRRVCASDRSNASRRADAPCRADASLHRLPGGRMTSTLAAYLHVVRPGALTTVQDAGRPGWAHLGVGRSGALDAPAARLANRLVGNPPGAAVLETTLTGCAVRPDRSVVAVVGGAGCPVRVDGRPVAWGEPVRVPARRGAGGGPRRHRSPELSGVRGRAGAGRGAGQPVGGPPVGARARPAGRGGHRSAGRPGEAERPGGVGRPGGAERSGEEARTGRAMRASVRRRARPLARRPRRAGAAGPSRAPPRLVHRARAPYPPDRRLPGLTAQQPHRPPHGRPRAGTVPYRGTAERGSGVGGHPGAAGRGSVVFLHDHPTTGGYPVVGVVAERALAGAAQAVPGTRLRFVRS